MRVPALALVLATAAQAPAADAPNPCVQFLDRPRGVAAKTCAEDENCWSRLTACLEGMGARVAGLPKPVKIEDQSAVNRELDDAREDFESIKKWASAIEKALRRTDRGAATANLPRLEMSAALREVREQAWSTLRRALREHGLFEPIFGELVTGTSFASVGSEGEDLEPEQAQQAAYVVFESRHQRLVGRLDGSIAGRFGFQPLLAMFQAATSTGTTTSTADPKASTLPAFQSGFVWELGGKLNLNTGWGGEGSAFYRSGQGRLLGPGVIAGGDTSAPAVAIPVGRDDGPTRWSHELGVRWVLFTGSDENYRAHERRILDPLFEVSTGWRWDDRFRSSDVSVGSEDARQRYFFRFFVNVKLPGGADLVGQPLAVAFGVEHEGGRHGGDGSIPAGTRLILRGDLNLIKALTGGSSP